MLRRIPTTPLVCLAIITIMLAGGAAFAAGPEDSLEVLLKPDHTIPTAVPAAQKAKTKSFAKGSVPPAWVYAPMPGISKVKPVQACAVPMYEPPTCILPSTRPGQWEMSAQAFFARSRGSIMWPRYSYYGAYNDWYREADFNDDLGLPAHKVIGQFTAKYQFRPHWAVRYSILADDFNGGGQVSNNNFYFGNQYFSYGQILQSKWQHRYNRLGVVFDALRSCSSAVAVFADWVHTDDRLTVGCNYCGYQTSTFSKNGDSAMVGLELQRCIKTAANGGTFSFDHKAGVIFLDDVEGWDVQAGARYSIPLNYGRWGYMKGGYRYVEIKKSQSDYAFKHALEGGYMEFGFIF